MNTSPRPASPTTARVNSDVARHLHLDDERDSERATRGLLAPPPSLQIPSPENPAVDLEAYAFLDGSAPETVNPALWRQAQLNMNAGLFEVVPGVYQVRGYDYANVTFIEGETGWIVIDPLTARETAGAALELANATLGEREVVAVIYTHSHVDHFGGVHGVVDPEDVASGKVRCIAPEGFLNAAVSENVIAGNAMGRRAMYMYGPLLAKSPTGHVDGGIGKGLPFGRPGLIAPNETVYETGEVIVVDGVPIEIHNTPDSEAPAEIDFYLPDHRALCMAENCVASLHNLYTPRGAMVRDGLRWSKYLHEAIDLFGDRADVMFICHHWPIWGADEIVDHIAKQRDMYRFIHDQTMRLANHGYTIDEIGSMVELPDSLKTESGCREFYGTVSFNSRAVYQRYLGWFDGNPAHLNRHPPEDLGARYVDAMGGAVAALDVARRYHAEGDDRFAAEVASHVVFADPGNEAAKELMADSLEQMGYRSESAPWRDFYLSGANELRNGTLAGLGAPYAPSEDMTGAMTTEMLLDYVGVCLNGEWAAAHPMEFVIEVTDTNETWRVGISNGALHARPGAAVDGLEILRCNLETLAAAVVGPHPSVSDPAVADHGPEQIAEIPESIAKLFNSLDRFERFFNIITP